MKMSLELAMERVSETEMAHWSGNVGLENEIYETFSGSNGPIQTFMEV